MGSVTGVEVLTTGVHQNNPYTERDIDDIIRNFNDFCKGDRPLVKIPTVIGHEEDQPLTKGEPLPLDNTGIPKVGTITDMWKDKPTCWFCKGAKSVKLSDGPTSCPVCRGSGKQIILKANIKDVPKSIATLINSRAYDKVSAEVYPPESLPENVPAKGKMFRRLALLGGELPQIKALADLPMADYREEQYGEMRYQGPPVVFKMSEIRGQYICLSEITKMADRNQMMKMVGSYGMSDSMCGTMSDEMLSECVKMCQMAEKLSEDKISQMSEQDAMAKLNEIGLKKFGEGFKASLTSPHADSDKLRADVEKDHKDNIAHSQELQNKVYGPGGKDEDVENLDKQSEEKDDDDDDKKKKKEEYAEKDDDKDDKKDDDKKVEKNSEEDDDDDEDEKKKKVKEHSEKGYEKTKKDSLSEEKKDKKEEKYSEKRKASAMSVEKFAELEPHINALVTKLVGGTLEKLKPIEERIEKNERMTREKEIHAFCEKHQLTGQITAAEMDKGSGLPTLEQRLLALEHSKQIHKFGEKQLSQLDIEMECIKRRPVPSFQEKIPVSKEVQEEANNAVLEHVERFCEENAKAIRMAEMTKEDIIKAWKSPKTTDKDRAELIKGFDQKAYHMFCERGYFRNVEN